MFNVLFSICDSPQKAIDRQISIWKEIPEETRKQIQFILVDDYSKHPWKLDINFKLNLLVPRIDKDIYWNPPGAKNLAFLLADNDWIFNCDIDHTISAKTYCDLLEMKKDRKCIYFFTRWLPNNIPRNKDSSNLFVVHRNDWWLTGGYDEDFSGNHGYDDYLITGNFYNNESGLVTTDPNIMKNLGFSFIRTTLPIIEHKDSETGDNLKKTNSNLINKKLLLTKLELLKANKYIHSPIIRFPWHIEQEYNF